MTWISPLIIEWWIIYPISKRVDFKSELHSYIIKLSLILYNPKPKDWINIKKMKTLIHSIPPSSRTKKKTKNMDKKGKTKLNTLIYPSPSTLMKMRNNSEQSIK